MKKTISENYFKNTRIENVIASIDQRRIVSIWSIGTGHFFEVHWIHKPGEASIATSTFDNIHDAIREFNEL